MTAETTTAGWLAIATLLRPQGRRGELLAEPLSDVPEIFSTGRQVALVAAGTVRGEGAEVLTIEGHWFPTGKNAGRVVLKLSGCESIGEAEALAGRQLLMASGELPELDADTFLVGDLLGCVLFDGETAVGTVVDVEFATGPDGRTRLADAAPLLAVQLAGSVASEPVLVPFIRAWLESVDVAAKRMVMHLPEGLVDGADGADGVDGAVADEAPDGGG